MNFPKLLMWIAIILFCMIGVIALFKGGKGKRSEEKVASKVGVPLEVELNTEVRVLSSPLPSPQIAEVIPVAAVIQERQDDLPLPEADRIDELFNKVGSKLPFVETVTYKSKVSWLGRPAWLSDYATHYSTSKHFIARSLNGKPEYFKQDLAEGDRFNVISKDKNLNFYLLIDISRCKMWFYSYDLDTNQRILLKTYKVGLGRPDPSKQSSLLTPLGKYSLGDKIAIYKPKMMGVHNGQKTEMLRVFGSRWIPFSKELEGCTAPAKGYGIHGVPWVQNEKGELVPNPVSLNQYESDGCIRLDTGDIEEIFAIVITKPTIVELVRDFYDAKLPGVEN